MSEPYYSDDYATIYHGDCREVLPSLPKVGAIVSDPPYGMAWGFTGQGSGKGAQGGRGSRFSGATIKGDAAPFDPSHLIGYPTVVLWGMHHYPQHLHRGSVLVWVKKYPDAFGTFLSDADIAWANTGHGVYCSPVVNPARFQHERQHPTQKPVNVMEWCIDGWGGTGIVCDPYAGSGTTLVAAKNLGRESIGIEIEERYCEIAAERLSQEVLDLGGAA